MILYVGNILSERGGSVGFIEMLTPKLSERYSIRSVSAIKFKLLRLLHMIAVVWRFRKGCDVVLIDTFSTQAFWFAYIVSRTCVHLKIPYITILHGGNLPFRLAKSPTYSNTLLSESAANISPSLFLMHQLQDLNLTVKYIPNFIDLPRYAFKLWAAVRPKLLWVRAFHKIYNPLMAVEVLYRVKQRFPEAQLCMVGADTDGSLMAVKEKIRELNIVEAVKLTGRLSKKEWIRLSEGYDIFINTTHIDNMPVSVIEAMALGFPIVSTLVGGIPFLLHHEDTALLTADADSRAMADAVLRILENHELANGLSRSARTKAETFDWAAVRSEWFAVLDEFEKGIAKWP